MNAPHPLVLRFDPQTVDHLGARMYSHLPNAVAELIANAYDADAASVTIRLGSDGTISVQDDGHGMSRQQLSDNYLHIGRNRRDTAQGSMTESGRRHVSGKKGLGKLALFGIGHRVTLTTSREGTTTGTIVELSYEDMMSAKGHYSPGEKATTVKAESHGTLVELSDLKRKTKVDAKSLAISLSRLFNFTDTTFAVLIIDQNGVSYSVTSELRLASVAQEFRWVLPEDLADEDTFLTASHVSGEIIAAAKPLSHGMRGITLYANGRMINEPEFFGASESSYAFSYLTGSINVDFIDDYQQDVIATDRRAIDWGTPQTELLRTALKQLVLRVGQDWRKRRAAVRKSKQEQSIGMTTESWLGSIQAREQGALRKLVESLSSDNLDLTADQQGSLLAQVKQVAPPHAEYVWRNLHPEIQAAAEKYYLAHDYFQAIQEAIKRYVHVAKTKAALTEHESMKVISLAFGPSGKLQVFEGFRASGKFSDKTIDNVEEAQKHISMGIIAGFRNPLAHEEIEELHSQGAFTFQDCLDALSILSHLARRLDDAPDVIV